MGPPCTAIITTTVATTVVVRVSANSPTNAPSIRAGFSFLEVEELGYTAAVQNADATKVTGYLNINTANEVVSPDGAFKIKQASFGNILAISSVGGDWSASWVGAWNSAGGAGGNITLQSSTNNMSTWTTIVGGNWQQHGGSQIITMHNLTSGKLYRITRMISSAYLKDPVTIEVLI